MLYQILLIALIQAVCFGVEPIHPESGQSIASKCKADSQDDFHFGQSCYSFNRRQPLSFHQALDYCKSLQMDMWMPDCMEEWNAIRQRMEKDRNTWIGGRVNEQSKMITFDHLKWLPQFEHLNLTQVPLQAIQSAREELRCAAYRNVSGDIAVFPCSSNQVLAVCEKNHTLSSSSSSRTQTTPGPLSQEDLKTRQEAARTSTTIPRRAKRNVNEQEQVPNDDPTIISTTEQHFTPTSSTQTTPRRFAREVEEENREETTTEAPSSSRRSMRSMSENQQSNGQQQQHQQTIRQEQLASDDKHLMNQSQQQSAST